MTEQPAKRTPHLLHLQRLVHVAIALFLNVRGLAQEIDTVIFAENRKQFTVLDQIEDRRERKAFLAFYRERDPRKKKKRAEVFLAQYSQSWLLAQAYEIAAKAAIDLEDYPHALQYGKESLRLLPENPLLLVPLANVQLQQGLTVNATQCAHDALEYLDRFARPASIKEKAWPRLERQLRASSYYVLGKATASEGLASAGPQREHLLRQSEDFLFQAVNLNPDDPEIAYLLGLAQLGLGKPGQAALQFRMASRIPGPIKDLALEQLRKIGGTGASEASLGGRNTKSLPVPATSVPFSGYAGSEACRDCHLRQYSAWEQTGMARMFRTYDPANVIGDFVNNNLFQDETGFTLARMLQQRGRHYFEIRRNDGTWDRYPVDYTIGSKWQQAYAFRLPGGQIQVLPIQYNSVLGRWVNYWKLIDPPGSERAEVGGYHRSSEATAYQLHCASCHTSQLRLARQGGALQAENLVFREGGVNCEMCHGPSERHAEAMRSGRPYAREPGDPPVAFRGVNHRDYVAICAQCHMQSAVREPGPQGEMNYSAQGDSFFPHYASRPYTEFSRKAFYKDGRFRETTFIVESFLRSACFRKGQAQCGHCHDPHPPDPARNPKSLKFPRQPDRMCLQCHSRFADRIEVHTHHAAASEASRCVSCHMPRIMNSVMFQARTHQISDSPDAEMTLRFGQQESPNACLLCHTTRDASWVEQRLQAW